MRSDNITVLEPGTTITVVWDETIDHPGHYRIAFDDQGDDGFQDPPCLANCDTTAMVIGTAPTDYSDPTVLADGIADQNGGRYSYTVTLPNIECDQCTLQLIQVMTDRPPYASGGNDIYYQCADLVLIAGGVLPDAGTSPPTGGGCSCRAAPGSTPPARAPIGAALVIGLAALLVYRRRKRRAIR